LGWSVCHDDKKSLTGVILFESMSAAADDGEKVLNG
jgi:hypothetical protein